MEDHEDQKMKRYPLDRKQGDQGGALGTAAASASLGAGATSAAPSALALAKREHPSDPFRFCRGSRRDSRVRESPSGECHRSHLLDMEALALRCAPRCAIFYATCCPRSSLELGKLSLANFKLLLSSSDVSQLHSPFQGMVVGQLIVGCPVRHHRSLGQGLVDGFHPRNVVSSPDAQPAEI